MQLAPGFGEEQLAPLAPLGDQGGTDPKKKPVLAPGFGKEAALPAPSQQATESGRLAKNYIAQADLENYMAGNQSGLELFGKAMGQAVPNALLGTVEAMSYLGDVEQMIDKIKGDEAEYTNWLADAMKKGKEELSQSGLKVFQTAESREGFAPGDATWWASHTPDTIGSALSLLIPAAGVAGLVGKGAKALKMTQGATNVAKGLAATVTSRYAESTMEAGALYERAYNDLLAKGESPEVARMQAGQQASNVWNTNWLFAAQDFLQYSSLLKGFSTMAKGGIGKSIGEITKQTASEGLEEAGQFVVQEEAYQAAMDTNSDFFGSGFNQRLYEYIRDPEFKTSVVMGAMGGGVFTAAGPLGTAAQKGGAVLGDAMQKSIKKITDFGLKKERANYVGDTGTSQMLDNVQFTEQAFNKMKEGKLANYKQDLENLKSEAKAPEVSNNLDNYIKDIDFLADEEAKLKSSNIPAEVHERALATKLEQRQLGRLDKQLSTETEDLYREVIDNKELAEELAPIKRLQTNLEGYRQLAASNPQFNEKLANAQKAFDQAKITAEIAFPNLQEALTTSRDSDLVGKTFQLLSTKEKMALLKKDIVDLTTPEGIARIRKEQADKAVNEQATAVLNNPTASKEEILQAAANATNPELKVGLAQKHQALLDKDKTVNQEDTKGVVEVLAPEEDLLPPPPEDMAPEFDEDMVPVEELPEGPTELEVPFAGGLSAEQAQRWGGLSQGQVEDILGRLDIEQKKATAAPVSQQEEKNQLATEDRQRTTVPAWLKEVDEDNTATEYTNNITGEKATADKIFAVDQQTGQLLANTPKIPVGTKVTLRLENDFPWTLTPGFKPNKEDNFVINVYIEGNPKPIKQLPSADNPRLADQKVIKELRAQVIAQGELQTTIVSKNVGTIRQSPVLNSLEVLQSDFVRANEELWSFQMTPHLPVLGYIDFNGNPLAPNIGAMKGITDDVINNVENTLIVPRSNELSKLKGKVITFRTAPDGTKRIVGLEPRVLNEQEYGWLTENLPKLVQTKDHATLSNIVYMPQHPVGVYSTKGGKKPDLLKLDRRRIHLINTTKDLTDVVIPVKGNKQSAWIIVDSSQLEPMLANQPFTFRVMGEDGTRSQKFTDHPKQGEIVDKFKKLLSQQFKNVNSTYLNSEIQYTDPVTNKPYNSYYEYLVQTATVQTNLPGSKTLGTGEDSSYSFNQVAIYLDPNPAESKFTVSEDEQGTIVTGIETTSPEQTSSKSTEVSADEALDEFFGPDAKLKPATDLGFKVMSPTELAWFTDKFGEEALSLAKSVDRFVAKNGLDAFGQYYNGLVTLAEHGEQGTAYHEALHFFADPANGLVTKRQSDLINKIGEEKLAEEFEKYKLSDGKYKPREEVRSFFRQLWNLIKNLLGFKSPIEKLFKDIDGLNLSVEEQKAIQEKAKTLVDPAEPRYKKLPGFKFIKQQQEAIAAFSSEVIRIAADLGRQEELDLTQFLTNQKNVDIVFSTVRSNFEADFNNIKASKERSKQEIVRYYSYLAMGIGTPESGEESYVGTYEDSTTATGFPVDGFKTKVMKDLARYGFSVKIKDSTIYTNPDTENAESVENAELKSADEAERLYDVDHTLINPSTSMSQRMKLFLASIPEPVLGSDGMPTGEVKKTVFGTTKFLDFRKVDGNLALKLRDSINPITRLTELAKNDAISKTVLDALMNEKNKNNVQLFNEFAAKYNRDGYYKKTILYGTKRTKITRPEDVDPSNPKAIYRNELFAKTIDSDRASTDRTLQNRWREEGVRKKVTDTDGTVNIRKAEALYKRLATYGEKFYLAKQKKANLPFAEVKAEFNSILGELGVVLPSQLWSEFDLIPNPGMKYKRLEDLFFGTRRRSLEQLLVNTKDGKDPFEGSSVLSTLSKMAAPFLEDSRGGAYRNDEGNLENPINWPSALTELANNIKNNAREIYEYYTQDAFYTDNQFLQAIRANPDKIDVNFTSVIRRNDDDPKAFADRGEIESVIMRLTSFYNNGGNEGFFFTGTPADKTKQPIVSLPKKKGIQAAKDFLFTVLKGTMNSEIVRIQRLKNSQSTGTILTPLDIANYKNGSKFLYIPGLNGIPNLVEQLSAGETNKEQFTKANEQASVAMNDFIASEFSAFKGFLAENDIISINEKGEITSNRIPEGLLDGRSIGTFIEEFFYNDLAWRLEVSKVLMGDIALYKNPDDYFKRAYQTVTPGIKGYSETPVQLNRAIYSKQMKVNTPEYLASLVALGADKATVEKYAVVNKTDAQSLMDIESYKTLAESLGQWSKDHERVYRIAWSKGLTAREATNRMLATEAITEDEAKRLRAATAKILLQPFKPFQFNNRLVNLPDGTKMIIKEQFKDSITPITPELTAIHKGYKDLLSFMKTNKIGIMSAEDTTKVGLYGVVSDISQPVQDWQKRIVNLTDFRFPQLLPDKKKTDIKGTQLHKLILGNIEDKTMYKIGRTSMLGSTIKEKYNELWAQKIQDSSASLQKKLGVGEDFTLSDNPATRKDQLFKLKTVLEQELLSRDLNENYQDLLELVRTQGDIDFTVPISFPAFGQKFQAILTNLWKKNVLSQDSPGYSAVNLADFGVGYDDELQFVTNKDGELVEAEIGLPLDNLSSLGLKYGEHILPSGRIMWDKLNNNQQEALQFILYRIPTSNKSSMLPVRVVKIVPSNLNNVVIIPGELTIQQGLDFDVDKSQLLKRVTDKEGKVDSDNVDTKLFNIYWSILMNKAHTQELLTPLASPTLEMKFQQYQDMGILDLGMSSSVASAQADVKAEIRNKDGKAEIGIASRFNTGHVVLQNIKDYVGVAAEINILVDTKSQGTTSRYRFNELGRTFDIEGTYISENHAESQQAALDAAKNPLLAYLGVVTGTMSTFHTMIDFGVPIPIITDFFMQPVVREWTKFYKQEGQNPSKATEKLFTNYPAIKNQVRELNSGKDAYNITSNNLHSGLTTPIEGNPIHDAAILREFLKINGLAAQLGKINNVLSIDTFQDATGIEALEAFIHQKNTVTDEKASIYLDPRVFDVETAPESAKRLANFYKHGIENAVRFTSQFFPSAGQSYANVRSEYAKNVGETGLSDKNLIKQLNQFTDYFNLEGDSLLSRTLFAVHPQKGSESYRNRWTFFAPEMSLWKYIDQVLEVFPALKNNELVRNLETIKVQDDKVQIVGIRNTDNNTNKTEITNGWYELLQHPTPMVSGLGHDLVRYAIWTTAFNFNQRSMFELIPVSFWVDSGLSETWRNIAKNPALEIDSEGVIVNFIRHNFKNLDRFPELYGRFQKDKGFFSDMISNAKLQPDTQHITEFNLSESYLEDRLAPRFFRFNDRELGDYRLYESNPNDITHFKEVQPSGQMNAYYEISADGRELSKVPANSKLNVSPNPWSKPKGITTSFPLIGNVGGKTNPYVAQYLSEDKNSPEVVLQRLIADETNVEGKKGLEALLRNINKINTPIELEELQGKLGVFEIYEDGTNSIKINPKGNVTSEGMMRHVLGHELHHGFSVGVLQNPQGELQTNFVRNLDRIVKESGYDVDNFEFIAELASNTRFRAKLRDTGLWNRIIRAFRNLLGMTDKYDQILNEYYNVLDNAETLQDITPSEYAMKEEEVKPKGQKRIDLMQQMLASLKAREDRLKNKGKRKEAKELSGNIKVLEELSKTKRNEAVVKYLITVEEEMAKLKNAYDMMAKDPSRINPDALYGMREQLVSYKLLDSFSDQIHQNPDQFVPEGGNSEILLKSLDELRADVHKMNNNTRRLAIQRFASVVKENINDPKVTLESIVDQLEVADRDIDFINRWTEVGMEMDDVAVRTAHKMLTDNTLSAYRAIQDDLYINEPKKQTAKITLKEKVGKKTKWVTQEVEYMSEGMFNVLNDYEAWLKSNGKNPNSIADKFSPVIDTKSMEQNEDGVHLVSPFSSQGKRILAISPKAADFPLRRFYETFVLGYLKSQENIPALALRPGLRIPSIQRSMLEGIIKEQGTGKLQVIKEAAIDAVRKRYDESDFKAVDENGKPQEYIPVRFIAKQDGVDGRLSTREVSLDIASTLPLFIHEMYSRKGLEELHSDLELGKLVLAEREVMKTRRVQGGGLTPWLTREREGITLASGKFDTIKGEQSKSFEAYDSLLRRFLYGQVKKSEGDVEAKGKKFSVSKMVDSFLGFTGFKIMFGNLAIPLTNGIMGEISMVKEVVGGNLIDKRDYAAGNKFFSQVALPSMQDVGRREKKTKAGRVLAYFNPLDHNRPVGDIGVDTNWMRTIWNTVGRSGGTSIEFYLGAKAIGATFNRFKATNSKGEGVSLYEALEVSNSGKIQLADGYTYNSKKSISGDDINQVRNYTLRVYQLMNGVYNKMDKNAASEYAAGRLLFFMRNWLIPGIQARWKTKHYDERLQKENEGHYLSALVAFNNAYSRKGAVQGTVDTLRILTWFGASDPELLLLPNELNLSQEEKDNLINMRKANIRKTLFELYLIGALSAVLGLAWDDDDESYTKYMLARVRREVSTFYSPSTAWDVLRSPTVALNTVDGLNKIQGDLFGSLGAVITGEDQPMYESGPYKGEYKLPADLKRQLGLGFEKQFEDLDTKTRLIMRGGYK